VSKLETFRTRSSRRRLQRRPSSSRGCRVSRGSPFDSAMMKTSTDLSVSPKDFQRGLSPQLFCRSGLCSNSPKFSSSLVMQYIYKKTVHSSAIHRAVTPILANSPRRMSTRGECDVVAYRKPLQHIPAMQWDCTTVRISVSFNVHVCIPISFFSGLETNLRTAGRWNATTTATDRSLDCDAVYGTPNQAHIAGILSCVRLLEKS
jgi:hypothetical protein